VHANTMLAPDLPGTGFRAAHRALFQVSPPSGFNPSRCALRRLGRPAGVNAATMPRIPVANIIVNGRQKTTSVLLLLPRHAPSSRTFGFALQKKQKIAGGGLWSLWATGDLLAGCGQPLAVVHSLPMGNREAVSTESGRAGLSTNPHA